MQETLINHPKLHVRRRTGREGPKHDPYAFEETIVKTPRGEVILHMGLVTWLKLDGKEWPAFRFPTYADYEKAMTGWLFEACTGYTQFQLARIARKLKEKCSRCGSRRGTKTLPGYPGEYLEVCVVCGHVNGDYFCEEEII